MKILRLSSHPTKKFHGVGLHAHKISDTGIFHTFFIVPKLFHNENLIDVSSYNVFDSKVYFAKRPVNTSCLRLIFFFIKRTFKILKFTFFSISIATKHSIDIVHIHSPMYILVALWAKVMKKNTCITYHGTDYIRVKNSKLFSFFSKKLIDIGFCVSPKMVDTVKKFHKKVYYVPNGIDPLIFKNYNKEREKIVLAVGSLKKEKSYKNLLEAFSIFSKDNPGYKLNIAGEGPLKSEISECISELRLNDKVSLLGNLNQKRLVYEYNKSEIFVLASSTEGFPKVVLEAIFCGCKVISTDVGSVSTFLPEDYLIPDNSPKKINKYLNKIKKLTDYKIDILKLRKEYTWQNVILKYKMAYESNF